MHSYTLPGPAVSADCHEATQTQTLLEQMVTGGGWGNAELFYLSSSIED